MRLNKRESRLLTLAIIIILTISLIKGFLIPLWKNHGSIGYKIIKSKALLKRNEGLLNNANRIKNKLEETKGRLLGVNSTFFNQSKDRAKLELLNLIEEYIRASGLEVRDKSLQMEKIDFSEFDDEQYSRAKEKLTTELTLLVCRLNLKGSLNDLVSFLDSIEGSSKFLKIDYLAITANKSSTKLSIDLIIKGVNREGDKDVE
jgi:hypothetical protein